MTQNSQISKANMYSEQPRTRTITPKVIFFVALALISTALWIHNLFVPSLTGNWLWVCSLFTIGLIIGSSSLAIWNFKKWWPGTQNIQQQETTSSPTTSKRSFSPLMWLYSILEVALVATLIVIQFNGNAYAKELSHSLISGFSVSLFLWLAYRASRYIDW
jgi:hypothetical protein